MRYFANSLDRESLRTLGDRDRQIQNKSLNLLSVLKRTSQRLMRLFVGSNELRVWQTYDRSGQTWWHGFDPMTGRSISVDTEEQMRIWIEQRYYS